ncbi:MAG: GNAT family N-acetyltransferase [Actinobacteria bacterium]|nr:GNAT family N-acetyltransferase [Actinomycetota bacterium]
MTRFLPYCGTVADLQLTVLDEDVLDLLLPWFDDDVTRLALGDRDWLRRSLHLMASQPGTWDGDVRVDDRVVWVAYEDESPVGLIDVETYADGSASFAVVVAPSERRRGLCARIVEQAIAQPRVATVTTWFGDVAVDDVAGAHCLERVGFSPRSEELDDDSMVRYERAAEHRELAG